MIVKLINMPFADIAIPSIALTQLKSVSESIFGEKIKVDIHYLNHDFAQYMGIEQYQFMSLSGNSNNSGFGDWFFAQCAHPGRPDNSKEYLMRYGNLIGSEYLRTNGEFLTVKRQGLGRYIDELIDVYELADANIIGLTSMFMQNVANLAIARRIKQKNKDVIIVMGGANCESPMGEELIRNFDVIDYAFSGTSLISFPKFLNHIMNGSRSECERINGVLTKRNCNNVVAHKPKAALVGEEEDESIAPIGDELSIDECVPLDYDSFLQSFDRYFKDSSLRPQLLFETSRGCWWGAKAHCTFCGLNGGGMAYRSMNSAAAINMINNLIERYQHRIKHFGCVDNIIPREYILDVFPRIVRQPDITIFYEVRADLNPEEMQVLSDAGVVEMQPGVEALATSTLKLMKKGTTAFNNIRFLQNALKYSIRPYWNLLIGFPGEEEAVYEKYCADLPLLYHLPPPIGVFPVRFDRYSPYFTQFDKYNLDLHPLEYYFFNYPLSEESLKKMAYYFGDHNYEADYITNAGKWISRLEDKVVNWKKQWSNISKGMFPKLFFSREGENDLVIDTRLPVKRNLILRPGEKDILMNFTQRKNISGIIAQMPEVAEESLIKSIKRLKDMGLLFEENGTYMNIVFESEPFIKRLSIFQ